MKFLIFFALVALALSAPTKKPEKPPESPKPSHPPPSGTIHPIDHDHVTGLPPNYNSSMPPHPEDSVDSNEQTFDQHNVTGHNNSSKPPNSGDLNSSHPKPGGGPSPSVKPPAKPVSQAKPVPQAKPEQQAKPVTQAKPVPQAKPVTQAKPVSQAKPGEITKPRPKRHVNHAENHPTGAPHGDHTHSSHTHESGASKATHPANHGGGKPGGHKGQKG
ncbi:uncharacterized protein [Phyllobates terribilis]|uniref:uncharacterized protein n=1 Tax=Phyllobates terribilis TaxID=111132 RepID=UPI003CCAAF73